MVECTHVERNVFLLVFNYRFLITDWFSCRRNEPPLLIASKEWKNTGFSSCLWHYRK